MNVDYNEITINIGNIGYQVYLGANTRLQMGIKSDIEVELVIYTVVKEDEIRLYGFPSFRDRKLFALLLTVNGVGPKAAISIVDQVNSFNIVQSIKNGDYTPFLSVSGIGKKTAQRIILDLQGKIDNLLTAEDWNLEEEADKTPESANTIERNTLDDAKSALGNLGFTEREADRVVRKHFQKGISLDEIIRKSLADLQQ